VYKEKFLVKFGFTDTPHIKKVMNHGMLIASLRVIESHTLAFTSYKTTYFIDSLGDTFMLHQHDKTDLLGHSVQYATASSSISTFSKLKKAMLGVMTGSLLTLGLVGSASAADPVKAAFIYIGPTGDHGWTYSHDQGRIKTEAKLKGAVKTSYIENVGENADAERVMRNLAQQGNKVIFATSFGYMNQMAKVAKIYPNTVFMHATGYKTDKKHGHLRCAHL
jgi:hypothetical protein